MRVIVHRWQQNRGNYNNQTFELANVLNSESDSEGDISTFWGANFDGRMASKESCYKNFRTQKVDKVEVDTLKNEIHIYTSALVERKAKTGRKVSKEKVDAAMRVHEPLPSSANSVPIDKSKCEWGFNCPNCGGTHLDT